MLPAVLTQSIIHSLDWVAHRTLRADPRPQHQRTGSHGEEDAFFYLRKLGYVMVARNFRSPRCRGEIDLIGWDADVLCFIEVKTRTTRAVKPSSGGTGIPEAAATNVPVEIRYCKRILCKPWFQPADRSVSQRFLDGGRY